MKLKPLSDKVIVKREMKNNETESGIFIGIQHEKVYFGKVVAVGEGRTFNTGITVPLRLKVGDNVYWSYLQGTEIEQEDGKYYVIVEDGIFCKVE